MRAMVNPSEREREQFDNNNNIVNAVATLAGASVAMIFNIDLKWLLVLAFIGNATDNFFYLYIYKAVNKDG